MATDKRGRNYVYFTREEWADVVKKFGSRQAVREAVMTWAAPEKTPCPKCERTQLEIEEEEKIEAELRSRLQQRQSPALGVIKPGGRECKKCHQEKPDEAFGAKASPWCTKCVESFS